MSGGIRAAQSTEQEALTGVYGAFTEGAMSVAHQVRAHPQPRASEPPSPAQDGGATPCEQRRAQCRVSTRGRKPLPEPAALLDHLRSNVVTPADRGPAPRKMQTVVREPRAFEGFA